MEIIKLNLIPSGALPVVHASQYDDGRVFRADLFDGAEVYTLDGTEVLECDIKKPDGNVVTVALTNTSDSYLEITTTLQMCACSGESLGEINIKKGGVSIGTLNFILAVERSPLENGIESDSAIHNLQEQIAEAVADQYDADNVVFDNTPTAGHGVGFAVTSEGVLNAIPDELNDLSDVDINSAAVGEALVWNGAEWVNGTVSTVGSIDDLNDVDTTGKANADSLRYNATAQEWEAKPTTVEMTLVEYTALGGDYSGYENTNIIITDAPNLNATAQDISYDGGADTVHDVIEGVKSDLSFKIISGEATIGTVNGGAQKTLNIGDFNFTFPTGYIPIAFIAWTFAGTNTGNLFVNYFYSDFAGYPSTSPIFTVTNAGSSATGNTSKVTARLLCVKSTLVS